MAGKPGGRGSRLFELLKSQETKAGLPEPEKPPEHAVGKCFVYNLNFDMN